jgi:hypothetical protein
MRAPPEAPRIPVYRKYEAPNLARIDHWVLHPC